MAQLQSTGITGSLDITTDLTTEGTGSFTYLVTTNDISAKNILVGSSASNGTVFEAIGSTGQLFSIADGLTGSLLAVSDISGLPILEVSSDDKLIAGTYGQNTFVVSGSRVGIGTGNPNSKLEIKGLTSGTASSSLQIRNSSLESLFSVRDDGRVDIPKGAVVIGSTGTSNDLTLISGSLDIETFTEGIRFKRNGSYNNNKIRLTSVGNMQFLADGFFQFYDPIQMLGGSEIRLKNDDNSGNGIFLFNTGSSSASQILHIVSNNRNNTPLMVVSSSGNVTIGTTGSRDIKLHIYDAIDNTTHNDLLMLEGRSGDILADTSSGVSMAFKYQDTNNSTNEARIKMMAINSADFGDNDEAAANLIFSTTNGGTETDKMIITGRGDVAIGHTQNPTAKLHVSGANNTDVFIVDSPGGNFKFKANSTSRYTTLFQINNAGLDIGHDSNVRDLNLRTYNLDRVTIKGDGKVGIGTINPTKKLTVAGTISGSNILTNGSSPSIFTSTNTDKIVEIKPADTRSGLQSVFLYRSNVTGTANYFMADGANTRFAVYDSGTPSDVSQMVSISPGIPNNATKTLSPSIAIGDGGSTDAKLTIGNNILLTNSSSYNSYINAGNVGIGTSSPGQKLDVVGNARITGNTYINQGSLILSHSSANGIGSIFEQPTNELHTLRFDSDRFRFWAGGQERLTILSGSGNVGIGTSAPSTPLQISNAGSFTPFRVTNTTDSTQFDILALTDNLAIGSSTNHDLNLRTNNSNRLTIKNNGNVGIGTTSPTETLELGTDDKIKLTTAGSNLTGSLMFNSGDSHHLLSSFNASAGLDQQFVIKHNLGDTELINRRGDLILSASSGNNVAIQTNIPATTGLTVQGNISASDSFYVGNKIIVGDNVKGTTKDSLIQGFITDASYESSSPFLNPETFNAFAGANKWATEVSASGNYNYKRDGYIDVGNNPFNVGGDVAQLYFRSSSDNTMEDMVILIDHSNQPLRYVAHVGMQFTNQSWIARGVKIEAWNGSAWYTGLDTSNNDETTVATRFNLGANGVQKTKFTLSDPFKPIEGFELGVNESGSFGYVRISKIFGYDFKGLNSAISSTSSSGTYYIEKYVDSGHYNNIFPAVDNTYVLGTATKGYSNIYARKLVGNVSASSNSSIFNQIGIGTTTPNSKLDIRRGSDGTALELHSTVGDADEFVDFKMIAGNTNAGTLGTIFRHQRQGTGGGDMIIFTNNSLTATPAETIRFTSDQKVGIGTTSPSAQLHVSGTSLGLLVDNGTSPLGAGVKLAEFIHRDGVSNPRLRISSSNNGVMLQSTFSTGIDGEFRFQANGGSSYMAFDTGIHAGGGGEHMRLTSDGKLGVGTTTPQQSITTTGNLLVTSSNTRKIEISVASSSSKAQLKFDTLRPGSGMGGSTLYKSGALTYFDTDSDYRIRPNSRTALHVNGNGDIRFVSSSRFSTTETTYLFGDASTKRVGIGTTTPTAELDVAGDIVASGTVTADILTLVGTSIIEAETLVISGSNVFGSGSGDTHEFIGTITASNHISASGDIIANSGDFDDDITITSGSFRVKKYGEGLQFYNNTNYTDNRISLSTAQNMQFRAGGIFQFYKGMEILDGSSFTFKNEGNHAKFRVHNAGSGSVESSRLDIQNNNAGQTNVLMSVSSSGHVGIGTSDPDATLHVVGVNNINTVAIFESSDDKAFIRIKDNDTDSYLISKDNKFHVGANSSDFSKFNVNISDGNVGIGTNSVLERLHVQGGNLRIENAGDASLIIDTEGGGDDNSIIDFRENTVHRAKIYWDGSDNDLVISSSLGDLHLLPAGNVGIGTTSPDSKFQVEFETDHTTESISFTDAAIDIYNPLEDNLDEKGSILTFSDNYSGSGYHRTVRAAIKGGTDSTGNTANGFLAFYTDETYANSAQERMRIDSSGNVGIGTTTPTQKLTVSGNISASGNLFASLSLDSTTSFKTVMYDTATGQFFHTGSYGGGGSTIFTDASGGFSTRVTALEGAGYLTSSPFSSTGISGSFTEASGGFSTRVTSLEGAGYLTSSPFSSTGISGSFTEASGGFSTRITSIEGAGYLTSSPFSSTGISGSFTEASGGFSTRITTLEGAGYLTTVDISTNTNLAGGTNITLNGDTINLNDSINLEGDLSASGYLDVLEGGFIVTSSNTTLLEVVGDISASGHLFASLSDAGGSYNNTVMYDTATGRFYYTGSYGGGGGGIGNPATENLNMGGNNITSVSQISNTTDLLISADANDIVLTAVSNVNLNSGKIILNDNGHITASGEISASSFNTSLTKFSKEGTILINSSSDLTYVSESKTSRGEIVKFGNSTTELGKLYYYSGSEEWATTSQTDVDARGALLGIALGTNSDTDGMLLKGIAHISSSVPLGSQVYMGPSEGSITNLVPTDSDSTFRSVGHSLKDNTIYFNPSPDFIITS